MRVTTVLALVAAGSAPVAVMEYGEHLPIIGSDLEPILRGERNITDVAEEVAAREFRASVSLTVLDVELRQTRTGAFGETIKADPNHVFHFVTVRVENNGTMDVAISSWHFSIIDEAGSDHMVELGGDHDDFDGSRLRRDAERTGTIVFELRKGSHMTALLWEGDLASSRVEHVGPAG